MGSIPFRGVIAVLVLTASFVIFGLTDKLTFVDLLTLILPILTLYFGQYIAPPGSVSVPRESVSDPVPDRQSLPLTPTPAPDRIVPTTGVVNNG